MLIRLKTSVDEVFCCVCVLALKTQMKKIFFCNFGVVLGIFAESLFTNNREFIY